MSSRPELDLGLCGPMTSLVPTCPSADFPFSCRYRGGAGLKEAIKEHILSQRHGTMGFPESDVVMTWATEMYGLLLKLRPNRGSQLNGLHSLSLLRFPPYRGPPAFGSPCPILKWQAPRSGDLSYVRSSEALGTLTERSN